MTKPVERDRIYRGRWLDAEVIVLCVRCCICYRLTYRGLVEMMAECGATLAYTTILRWILRFVPEVEKRRTRFPRTVALDCHVASRSALWKLRREFLKWMRV